MNSSTNTPLDLLFDQLRDIYSMEVQISNSMPHLVSLCTDEGLRDLIAGHAQQTCHQIAEVSAIFERHGKALGNDQCKAMAGLIEGGAAHLEGVLSPHTRDLMMIAHCLRIECYERVAYEFATILSGRLGFMREPAILSELLAEEKDMAAALGLLEPELFEAAEFHRGGRLTVKGSHHGNGCC